MSDGNDGKFGAGMTPAERERRAAAAGIRRRLDPRRDSIRVKAIYREAGGFEMALFIDVGLDRRRLAVAEVFAKPGMRAGKSSMIERDLDDTAPLLSECLQRGATPDELAHRLGGLPFDQWHDPVETSEKAELLAGEVRARGAAATLEFTVPRGADPLDDLLQIRVVAVSSKTAALVAAAQAVQRDLDQLAPAARAYLRDES